VLVRALLTADRNQQYLRARMTEKQRSATPAVDFRPFIIADADTGHGGDPHVRNLVRRFVEAGVPGYHIEDQRPGTKKCGHQGGKVLVPEDESRSSLERGVPTRPHEGPASSSRTDARQRPARRSRRRTRPAFILAATNVKSLQAGTWR
jgi:isocitrate lyase